MQALIPNGCANGLPLRGSSAEDRILMNPTSIAETYWQLHRQPRDAWTHELDLRPSRETW